MWRSGHNVEMNMQLSTSLNVLSRESLGDMLGITDALAILACWVGQENNHFCSFTAI